MVEPDAGIQRDTIVQGDRVAREERDDVGRVRRRSTGSRYSAWNGPSAVDEPDASRDDGREAMFAALELHAGLALDGPRRATRIGIG